MIWANHVTILMQFYKSIEFRTSKLLDENIINCTKSSLSIQCIIQLIDTFTILTLFIVWAWIVCMCVYVHSYVICLNCIGWTVSTHCLYIVGNFRFIEIRHFLSGARILLLIEKADPKVWNVSHFSQ